VAGGAIARRVPGDGVFGTAVEITVTWISNGSMNSRSPEFRGCGVSAGKRLSSELRKTPFELFVSTT
jgi:hypothetical protein